MTGQFWDTYRPVVRNSTNPWNSYRASSVDNSGYVKLEFPLFNISGVPWAGSSFVLLEFSYPLIGQNFSLLPFIIPPINVNFCLAVRYGTSPDITRFKIWEQGSERLYYPLYTNQILPFDSVFEIWSVEDFDIVSLDSVYDLRTSIVNPRLNCCCTSENNILNLNENNLLFELMFPDANIPIIPDMAFVAP